MSHVEETEQLSITAICHRCREQTARFRRREPHDDRYCFDMIRRAIVDRDQRCWDAMTEIYHDLVIGWCRRAGADEAALADLAADTWSRFWQAYTVDKLNGAGRNTSAILAYLKLCARSVVFDEARRRERAEPYGELGEGGAWDEDAAESRVPKVEHADRDAFWSLIGEHLKDERERLLLYLSYELDLTPADIHRRYPDQFPAVDDVYKGRRNILERLSRSNHLARWLAPPD
jgi:DNA-directed RNA polymerase specialized sigma24 family protein